MKSTLENKLQQKIQSGAPKVHSEAERAQMWSTIQQNIPHQPVVTPKPSAQAKRLGIAGIAIIAFFGAAAFTSAVLYIKKTNPAPQITNHGPAAYPPRQPANAEAKPSLPEPQPTQAEIKAPEAGVLASKFSSTRPNETPSRDEMSASNIPTVEQENVTAEEPVVAETLIPAKDSIKTDIAQPDQGVDKKAEKVPVVVKKPVVVNNEEVKVVKVKSKFAKQAK